MLSIFSDELRKFEAPDTPLQCLPMAFLHSTQVAIAGFCLSADMIECGPHQGIQLVLLHRRVDSASLVLDLVALLNWETLPVHILISVLYSGIFAAQLLRLQREMKRFPVDCTKQRVADPDTSSRSAHNTHSLQLVAVEEELNGILNRTVEIFTSLAYGRDVPTRARIILEVLRRNFPSTIDYSHRKDKEAETRICSESSSTTVPEYLEADAKKPGVIFESRMAANVYWMPLNERMGATTGTKCNKS